jgi:hypothetical protein
MKNKLISSFFTAISGLVLAQGGSDVVTVVGLGNREVEPAYRMTENPKIIDTTIAATVLDYPLLVLFYPTTIEVEKIKPVTIKTEPKLPQLYPSYVKVGVGTELMPLGEVFFNSKRSRKTMYGVHLKHLSSFGNFTNYAPAQFDRTKLDAYGGIHEKKYTLRAGLNYANQGFHYYGWKIPTDSVDRKTTAQRFQTTGGNVSFASHQKDSAHVNYEIGLAYSNFTAKKPLADSLMDWRAKENFFALTSAAKYKLGKEIYAAEMAIRYNGYAYGVAGDTASVALDSGFVRNNTVINFKPTITSAFHDNKIKATIGVDVVVNASTKTRVHLYPVAEVNYSLFNDMFIPYAGLRGGMNQITYKSLATQNEFIRSNVGLRNENKAIDAYFGVKGSLSKRVYFHVNASFARIQDKAFFITDTLFSVGNKFDVIYDTLTQSTLEGSISYQMLEKLKIDVVAKLYSYNLRNNTYAWNLPQWQAILRGSYNLYDKFLVNVDINLEAGRRALVYAMEPNVTVENNQIAKNLGFIADINLGVEYRYNKRVSAFLQFNNAASQRYFRWYNHPVQIFQLLGGITARF